MMMVMMMTTEFGHSWTCMLTSTGIRRWNYFASEQLIVYDIAKYRWCENVQRFHRSNNIMWVGVVLAVDLWRRLLGLPLNWLFSLGSLWTWRRKSGTRSVMTPSARTSDPPVCANANANSLPYWLKPGVLTNTGMLQVTRCLRRSASATSWRWSVTPVCQTLCSSFSTQPTASALGRQDDEDQAYLMDDDGNVEPSQAPTETPGAPGKKCCADTWGGDCQDDQELMESLEDFEQHREEISDQLLLQCAAEFDSQ